MNYGRHNRVFIDRPQRIGTAESRFTLPSHLGFQPDNTRNGVFPHFSTSKINEDLLSEKNNEKQESDGVYSERN